MEIAYRGEVLRFSPTWILATNRSFRRILDRFLKQRNTSDADFTAYGSLRAFSARQFLLSGDDEAVATELFRGAPLVSPSPTIGEDRADDLAQGIAQWMLDNLSNEGELPYKYWPSRGMVSPADNAIRQFLASLSLARLGELRSNAEIREAARRNLRFNLKRYFRNIGEGRGAIVERTGAKLGAAALAALAILESPASAEFLPELEMLAAGVNSLADKDRGFRTFFFPPERDGDNWNFYSGEALLFWAEAMRRGARYAPTLEQCVSTFACCRRRHYQARNPAFVPWHTQACASLFNRTGRREFAGFVLEANDWLLSMQQWDRPKGLPPDLWGRFYDPQRPEFGPPHAASTGAYLEGLADAMTLAREIGDEARAAAYERAIARGLRSLRQLQFRSQHDAFYVSRRERVMGALRTEAYDNAVRIDSAAHALAASVKILQHGLQPRGGNT
ncbi:MAG: hypothetical protein OXB98_05110 [Bryobacterales bacterium]|nr:hypothetical protein [Bryobacterales bacterium]